MTDPALPERRLLLHLSDIHLFSDPAGVPRFWPNLLAALEAECASGPERIGIIISGDVFDTNDLKEEQVTGLIRQLVVDLRAHARIDAPILITPGNHDRRVSGLTLGWTENIVRWMSEGTKDIAGVHVHGASKRAAHATLLPEREFLDLRVVCYDSTHTYNGYFSAGGHVRTDDLFALKLDDGGAERPLLFIVHHHLVPTPVTDVEEVNSPSALKRFAVRHIVPRVIAFGNREEIFMTALGTGSLLTSLHALELPVLVLHGHKHYPTARSLNGLREDEGDVLLVSAGTAGLREPFRAALGEKSLWPSFNVIHFEGPKLDIETVYFSPHVKKKRTYRERLLSARHHGPRWTVAPLPRPEPSAPVTKLDEATFEVTPRGPRWKFSCVRNVVPIATGSQASWKEPIEVPKGAAVTGKDIVPRTDNARFAELEITPGTPATYTVDQGLCASAEVAKTMWDVDESPFEWLGLSVHEPTKRARLVVNGLPAEKSERAFATIMDLSTGARRPVKLTQESGAVVAQVDSCPAKRLIQVLWPIA